MPPFLLFLLLIMTVSLPAFTRVHHLPSTEQTVDWALARYISLLIDDYTSAGTSRQTAERRAAEIVGTKTATIIRALRRTSAHDQQTIDRLQSIADRTPSR